LKQQAPSTFPHSPIPQWTRQMDSIEQLREIYWDLALPLRRRIEAAAICIQYQGFGEAFDFLKRVGSEPEVAPSLRILALKYTAQYETRRKPPPTPMARD